MEEQIVGHIASVGFPAAVAFFLLTKLQKSMDQICDQIHALTDEIHRFTQ